MKISGTVIFVELSGGFWGIESDDAPALSSDFSFLLFFLKSNTEIVFYHDTVNFKSILLLGNIELNNIEIF